MQNGLRGDVDQILAVIDGLDLDAWGQDVGRIDFPHLVLNTLDRRGALLAAVHQDNALNDVVVIVLASDAQARQVTNLNIGYISKLDRKAAGRGDHGVGQLVG